MSTSRWRQYAIDPHNRTYKLPWPSRYRVAGNDVQILFGDHVLGMLHVPLSQNIRTCFQPRGKEIIGLSRAGSSELIRRLAAERMRLAPRKMREFYHDTTYLCPLMEHTSFLAYYHRTSSETAICSSPREPPLPCPLHEGMAYDCPIKPMGCVWRQWILVALAPPEEGRVRTKAFYPRPWGALGDECLTTIVNSLLWYHLKERGVPQPAFLRAWAERIGWT